MGAQPPDLRAEEGGPVERLVRSAEYMDSAAKVFNPPFQPVAGVPVILTFQ
jgi:hypothetical protein